MLILPYGAGTGGDQTEGGSQMDTGEVETSGGPSGTSSASAGGGISRVRTRSELMRAAGGEDMKEEHAEQQEQLEHRQQ